MEKQENSRRSFLKHILAGAAVVSGTLAATRSAKASHVPMKKKENTELYRDTQAFLEYYKSLRS